jgi:hypothetical protein
MPTRGIRSAKKQDLILWHSQSSRDPHGWADFRARAMIDWWDWAPTARMMHAVMSARLREEARHGPA